MIRGQRTVCCKALIFYIWELISAHTCEKYEHITVELIVHSHKHARLISESFHKFADIEDEFGTL